MAFDVSAPQPFGRVPPAATFAEPTTTTMSRPMRTDLLTLAGILFTALLVLWGTALTSRANAEAARATADAAVAVARIQAAATVTVARIQAHAAPLPADTAQFSSMEQHPPRPKDIGSP